MRILLDDHVQVRREDLRDLLHGAGLNSEAGRRVMDALAKSDEAEARRQAEAALWRAARCPVCGDPIESHEVKAGYAYHDKFGYMGGGGTVISADGYPKMRPVAGEWEISPAPYADRHLFGPCGHSWEGRWSPDTKPSVTR